MPTTKDNDQPTVRIGTWNVGWAEADSERGTRVADALKGPDCDIVCVTEGCADILPPDGHTVDAGPDWGYGHAEARRKVLVWSRRPWSAVDIGSSGTLPAGRLVAGITLTALGPLTAVGVCIPWRDAHVRSGRRDRSQWQEHETWLAGFESLPYRHAKRRTVVLGDFNQRVPRRSQPKGVHAALMDAFEGFGFATAGDLEGAPGRALDHIAHTPDMAPVGGIGLWPREDGYDNRLSNRFGVWGDLAFGRTGRPAARRD